MDPILGAVLAGGASAANTLIGMNQAEKARAQERYMWEEQMRWQTYMSNTAHQREVWDLKRAGLNPQLSVFKGAAVPGGGNPPNMPTARGELDLGSLPQSAVASKQLKLEAQRVANETLVAMAEVERKRAETALNVKMVERIPTQMFVDQATGELHTAQAKQVGAKTEEAAFYGRLFNVLNAAIDEIKGGRDSRSVVKEVTKEVGDAVRGMGQPFEKMFDWSRYFNGLMGPWGFGKSGVVKPAAESEGRPAFGGVNSAKDVSRRYIDERLGKRRAEELRRQDRR